MRAERQSGGKGRQGRQWQSPPGNLYISTIVRVRPGDPPAPTLALVAAVALHETLSVHCAPACTGPQGLQIKWPNDILAGNAKLAGILLERAGDSVVIGFGANLAHHPVNLDRPVTDVATLTGDAPHPATIAERLARTFATSLAQWRASGLAPIRSAWLAAAHPLGTRLTTSSGEGNFAGLDESGALLLAADDGTTKLVHAGDVFLM